MNWTTLVEAADLARALGNPALRVVDARFVMLNAAPDAGRTAYAESHIPGAVYADLNRDLSDLSKVGEGRHPLPDSVAFTRRQRAMSCSTPAAAASMLSRVEG